MQVYRVRFELDTREVLARHQLAGIRAATRPRVDRWRRKRRLRAIAGGAAAAAMTLAFLLVLG